MQETLTQSVSDVAAVEPVSMITFKTSLGLEGQATVVRLTPQSVTFEVYGPQTILRVSEVLTNFSIYADTRPIYTGKALISNIVHAGTVAVCEATLPDSLLDLDLFQLNEPEKILPRSFKAFLSRWQKYYRILPEYKVAVADLQNFLEDLRLWLDQIELGIRSLPTGDRIEKERQIIRALPAMSVIGTMFERFETVASSVSEELAPVHRRFSHRMLHPLLLCSPFMHRIFAKPLGYAGDYEMIDMILRNDCEGSSLFAKLLHVYILDQAPARSVRNRVEFFTNKLVEEASRVASQGGIANILSVGCGPAREIQNFIAQYPLSDQARIGLLDFNEETLQHAGRKLEETRRSHGRRTQIRSIKKSVHQLLRGTVRPDPGEGKYDLIYCSGLYDYLSDRTCKALNTYLYEQLLPGGLLVVTNFDPSNPIRNIQESLFEWFLIYRNGPELAELVPEQAAAEDCVVRADVTGCNVFLEARKPRLLA